MSYEEEQRRLVALWNELLRMEEDMSNKEKFSEQPGPSGFQNRSSDEELDACSEHSEHVTDTEQSGSDPDDPSTITVSTVSDNVPVYFGRDNETRWLVHKMQEQPGKTKRKNIVTKLPGVNNVAKNSKTVLDCWKLFFPDAIIENIVRYTNQRLDRIIALPSYILTIPKLYDNLLLFVLFVMIICQIQT